MAGAREGSEARWLCPQARNPAKELCITTSMIKTLQPLAKVFVALPGAVGLHPFVQTTISSYAIQS